MAHFEIETGQIDEQNAKGKAWLDEDYEHLGRVLRRRGIDIEDLVRRAQGFQVAVPSWGLGTGGTRFARFPGPGEPRDVFEKLEDCGTVFKLVRSTPAVSLHIPWDKPESAAELRRFATERGLHFDAMNSNTFQDQPGQKHSYKFGSLTHPDRAVRAAGRRPQHRVHRDRADPRIEGAYRLDRRRRELPRPDAFPPRPRPLPRQHARDLRRPARRLARVHGAQALRARLLLHRHQRLGRELPLRPRAGPQGLLPGGPRAPRART